MGLVGHLRCHLGLLSLAQARILRWSKVSIGGPRREVLEMPLLSGLGQRLECSRTGRSCGGGGVLFDVLLDEYRVVALVVVGFGLSAASWWGSGFSHWILSSASHSFFLAQLFPYFVFGLRSHRRFLPSLLKEPCSL